MASTKSNAWFSARHGRAAWLAGVSALALGMMIAAAAPAGAQQIGATGGAGGVGPDGNGGRGGGAGWPDAVGQDGEAGTGIGAGAGAAGGDSAPAPDGRDGGDGSSGGGGGGGYSREINGDITVTTTGGNGGNGGIAPTGNADGGALTGGGGGGGGDGVRNSAAVAEVRATVTGGRGGDGGDGSIGGGGGGGGAGVVMINTSHLTVNAAVTGGGGGDSGADNLIGGGGGGAGVFLQQGGRLDVNAVIRGGDAGIDVSGGGFGGFGGGGAGVVVINTATIDNKVNGTIAGGAGAGFSAGGEGIALTNGGSIINAGRIAGGTGDGIAINNIALAAGGIGSGGGRGFVPNTPLEGRGGVGITGANLTISNSGSIAGGTGGALGRADAIVFTGGTNRLELWAGSTITGNVDATAGIANTLALGGADNSTFDVSQIGATAQYRGFTALEKTGASTWTLTGTTTDAGPWTINGGTLLVEGSIASSAMTTVNTGAALSGRGTVGNTTVASGGVFAPGDGSAGSSMTVAGNLAFQSGAQYLVQITPAAAAFAAVTGTATLAGATVNAAFAPGSYMAKQYTILAAGGIGGTFAGLTANTPANFTSSLSYDPNHAYLDLVLNFVPPPPTPGLSFNALNANQQNVANTLVNFFNTSGGIPMAFGVLSPEGLSQVSGEAATGAQQVTFDAMNQFMGVMTDPSGAGRDGFGGSNGGASSFADEQAALSHAANGKRRTQRERDAYAAIYTKAPVAAPFVQRWNVWAAGYGGSQTTDGNAGAGSNSATSSIYGMAVGADYRISPDTLVGFALAGGGTNFSVAGGGTGRSDLFQAGAFARQSFGAAYITAALAYGWQDITTDRTVTANGVDRLRAGFDANAFSGRIESGYRFVAPEFGGAGLTPYVAAQVTTFGLPSYSEHAASGAGTFALAYAAKDVTATRSELGLRTDKSFALDDAMLTLRGRAAWAHNFDTDRSIGATFQTLPGASFVVNGAALAADSALVTASAETKWINGFSLAATFEGEFSNVTESYAGKGVVRYAW